MSSVSQFVSKDGKQVKISINGKFDFTLHEDFRSAYRSYSKPGVEFRVNLANTEYMDSSALGMLLLLREHAGNCKARVVLEAPSESVRKLLEIVNFQKLFVVEQAA
jgi:anti-anti-sigma factor